MSYFFLIMCTLQALMGLYLGWRWRWAFGAVMPSRLMAWYVFWPVVALIVMSFPLIHFTSRRLGVELPAWLFFSTAVLYGTLITGFFTALITDALALVARRLSFLQALCAYVHRHPHHFGFLVLGIVISQAVWGLYNAYTPRETPYQLTVHKPLKNGEKQLRIVHLSDLHISRFTSIPLMRELVSRVNHLRPDLIVLTGDVIDNLVKPYFDLNMPAILGGFESRYGVYVVYGNHDYFSESPLLNIEAYTQSNIRILRDEVLYLDDPGITLIGRDDRIRNSGRLFPNMPPEFTGRRASLASLTAQANPATPWILLDHQPTEIDEAIAQKIDLQFSGHTHAGQFFPFNLVVEAIYKESWGKLTQDAFTLIVSCGFSTWGPPLRFPSYAEIVVADVVFQPLTSP